MAAPDLTFARAQAVQLMTDECIITSDAGTSNDTFDYDTGVTVEATPTVVYEGVCMFVSRVRPTGTRAGVIDYRGAAPAVIQLPEVRIPYDSPNIPIGSNVEITAAQDASAVGDRFVVRDESYGTYLPWRGLSCNRWVEGQTIEHAPVAP